MKRHRGEAASMCSRSLCDVKILRSMFNYRDICAWRQYFHSECRTSFTVGHDIPSLKKTKGCEAADWGCARGKPLRLRLRRPTDCPTTRFRKIAFSLCGICKTQGDCAVDVPTCESEPSTQEMVSMSRVGSAFSLKSCQTRLT